MGVKMMRLSQLWYSPYKLILVMKDEHGFL